MANTTSRRQWVLSALERCEIPLTRYAFRLLGEQDSAREAVQHAFLQLCQRSPEELEGREAQWLFAVCRNKALDLIRGRRRLTSAGEGELAGFPGREPDPAAVAEQHDLAGRLGRLVAQLPAGQREAIDLWSEGFSYRQIAQIAGHSEGNVRLLVHRALKQLRQHCKVLT
ncbi:MAG: RNA polymerase sigma factor [Thermoguttaceae bacterium]|jgi:RNA polymerase sigma-70 factor (ECF subfamily)